MARRSTRSKQRRSASGSPVLRTARGTPGCDRPEARRSTHRVLRRPRSAESTVPTSRRRRPSTEPATSPRPGRCVPCRARRTGRGRRPCSSAPRSAAAPGRWPRTSSPAPHPASPLPGTGPDPPAYPAPGNRIPARTRPTEPGERSRESGRRSHPAPAGRGRTGGSSDGGVPRPESPSRQATGAPLTSPRSGRVAGGCVVRLPVGPTPSGGLGRGCGWVGWAAYSRGD